MKILYNNLQLLGNIIITKYWSELKKTDKRTILIINTLVILSPKLVYLITSYKKTNVQSYNIYKKTVYL